MLSKVSLASTVRIQRHVYTGIAGVPPALSAAKTGLY